MSPAGYVALVGALALCLALLELGRRLLIPRVRAWGGTLETAYVDGKRDESLGMLGETVVFRCDHDTARSLVATVLALHRRVRPLDDDRWGLRSHDEDVVILHLTRTAAGPTLGVAAFHERRGRLLGAVFWYKMVGRLGAAAERSQITLVQGVRRHRRDERLDEECWRWTAIDPATEDEGAP